MTLWIEGKDYEKMVIQANHDSEYKDSTLSDKIGTIKGGSGTPAWYHESYVKEFIKRLKDFIVGNTDPIGIRMQIDKLAGDKLT